MDYLIVKHTKCMEGEQKMKGYIPISNPVKDFCQTSGIVYFEIDFQHNIIDANKMIESLDGVCRQQFLGQSAKDSFQKKGIEIPLVALLDKRTSHTVGIFNGKQAKLRWDLHDEKNAHTYITVRVIDYFSDHQESLEKTVLTKMFKELPVAFYAKDCSGEYLYSNPYLDDISKHKVTKIVGRTDFETPWSESAQGLILNDEIAQHDIKSIFTEKVKIDSSKTQAEFMSIKMPYDYGNSQKGIIGISINLSEYKLQQLTNDISPFGVDKGLNLTKREMECVNLLTNGKSSVEIGMLLNISARTAEKHIDNIKGKLNCYKLCRLGYLVGKHSEYFDCVA